MRFVVALLLAACGAPHATSQIAKPAAGESAGPIVGAAALHGEPPRAVIESPHGGAIFALAVTPDGRAAISSDLLGGIRLWPALDGSREPVIVDLPRPTSLALVGSGDAFTAFALDEVGGLAIAQLGGDGVVRARASIAADPAYLSIAATELGVVAWRSDHVIVLYGADGAPRGQVGAEPGERIVAVGAAGRHAVAVVDDGDRKRLRLLELAPQVKWGAWIASPDVGDAVAIAPSGRRIATLVRDTTKAARAIVIGALAQGGAVIVDQPLGIAERVEFVDDDELLVQTASGDDWLRVGGGLPNRASATSQATPFSAGGGIAIASDGGSLEIITPSGNEYLGYDLESPIEAEPGPRGGLLLWMHDELALLDARLAVIAQPKPALGERPRVAVMRWLGGDAWVLAYATDGNTSVVVADLASGTLTPVREKLRGVPWINVERTSSVFAISFTDEPEVARYDANAHKVEELARSKTHDRFAYVPLAPALAGGDRLVRVRVGGLQADWFREIGDLDLPGTVMMTTSSESFVAADSSGRVYTFVRAGRQPLHVGVWAHGQQVASFAAEGAMSVFPDPRGERVAVVAARMVTLFKTDGTMLWQRPLERVHEALWLDDGALALVGNGGIARVDPATGAVTAARCGWKFSRSRTPHPAVSSGEPLCAQVER